MLEALLLLGMFLPQVLERSSFWVTCGESWLFLENDLVFLVELCVTLQEL